MADIPWRKDFLNDDELLAAAEQAIYELENIPLDNSFQTDEEASEGEEEITNRKVDETDISEYPEAVNDVEIPQDIEETEERNEQTQDTNRGKKATVEVNRKWKKKDIETVIPEYTVPEGPIEEHFSQCQTFSDYFLTVLGSSTLKDIVYQSNLYATQRHKNLNLKESELLAFIGINFFMGYHQLPSYKHYWSSASDLGVPTVSSSMTRNRFQAILSNVHVNDNSLITPENKDKVFKIRPLIQSLNNQFDILYHGTRELSVDESVILFKGRSTLKQYNPQKPIKRGYKLWTIADQNGYIKQFDVYQGKNETIEKQFQHYGLGERVVLSLTEKYWGKYRQIYFDNFFTSVDLLEKLKTEKTLACGTIRINRRGLPKDLPADKKMNRGDFDYRVSNLDITFFKWYDNRVVHLASNFHGTESTIVNRKQKDGTKLDVACPAIVKNYNRFMGGVDFADRLRQCYCTDRRSKKWWHRLFFGLLDIAFVNSYVIYKKMNPSENVSLLDFRRGVSLGLIHSTDNVLKKRSFTKKFVSANSNPNSSPRDSPTSSTVIKRRKYNYSVPDDVRLGNRGTHWITFTKERRRCEQCSSRGIESRPHSKCTACSVYLCINEKKNCFSEYHDIS